MKRREFLKRCSAAGLGVATPIACPTMASAADADQSAYGGPYYIVFNAFGGWDTTYLMDPKGVNEINRLYKEGDILTHGNHRFAPIAGHMTKGGMSNEDFFKRYGDDLLVVNGMDYSINNHSLCSRYMATGKLDSLAYPTFAALVAACQAPTAPLAFLTFGEYSNTGNLVPMSRLSGLGPLRQLAFADNMKGVSFYPYHDDFVVDRIEQAIKDRAAAQAGKSRLPRRERAQSMLYASQFNSKSIERVTPYIPKKQATGGLEKQVDVALACFKAGICVSANLVMRTFDSHGKNDPAQMRLIPNFLAAVDYTVRRAEELKIRDKLVIVLQSEMGRTPHYNRNDGKDHWSVGSIMFMGAGIKGNRVVGATDEKQFLVPVDPETLSLDKEKGIRIRPEHVHTALREFAGIIDHESSKQFPLKVPDQEHLQRLFG